MTPEQTETYSVCTIPKNEDQTLLNPSKDNEKVLCTVYEIVNSWMKAISISIQCIMKTLLQLGVFPGFIILNLLNNIGAAGKGIFSGTLGP